MITGTRAVFAAVASFGAPLGVFALADAGRWPQAAILAGLYAVYVVVEVVSWLRRERVRRRQRWAHLRAVGRPLADVTYSREDWAA